MTELIFAFTMIGLGVHSLGADGCQPVEKVTAGTYLWLEDELLPLPDSHFISSFGSKSVGEYGSVYEIHLHALRLPVSCINSHPKSPERPVVIGLAA